jgi:hypothetical protein
MGSLSDEEAALDWIGCEFDRAVVGIDGLAGAAGAGEEVGARRVGGLVLG